MQRHRPRFPFCMTGSTTFAHVCLQDFFELVLWILDARSRICGRWGTDMQHRLMVLFGSSFSGTSAGLCTEDTRRTVAGFVPGIAFWDSTKVCARQPMLSSASLPLLQACLSFVLALASSRTLRKLETRKPCTCLSGTDANSGIF